MDLSSWCVYMSAISGCVLEERKDYFTVTGVQIMSDLFNYLYFFVVWIYYKENNMHITKIINFIQKIKTTYGRKLHISSFLIASQYFTEYLVANREISISAK